MRRRGDRQRRKTQVKGNAALFALRVLVKGCSRKLLGQSSNCRHSNAIKVRPVSKHLLMATTPSLIHCALSCSTNMGIGSLLDIGAYGELVQLKLTATDYDVCILPAGCAKSSFPWQYWATSRDNHPVRTCQAVLKLEALRMQV